MASEFHTYFQNKAQSKRKKNESGVLGGIGYTLGKVGTGGLGILEGMTDYTVGGIAKLFGQDEYAEQLFANDQTGVLNSQLDNWYNPSKGMQVVGDVASGIGNSLVGIGAVAGASLLSGGTLTPLAASIVSGATIGLGSAGMSTAEAYKKTGQLGAKEFGYGALSGITEAGLEAVSGAAGKVGSKLFAKKTAYTVAKSSILKGIAKSFAGEAFEEGMSEILDPYFQRWTGVDPDAKNATIQEVGYAALIGGISGALLDGVGSSANAIRSTISGNKIVNAGQTNVVLDTAKEYAKYQEKNNTTNKAYQEIKSMVDEYESLEAKNASGTPNIRQRRLLGDMQIANTVLAFSPAVEQSKARILANADSFADYLNSLNIKMDDGSVFKTSAEDLRTNDALLTRYAVSDALGHILMDSKSVYDLTMSGDAETVQNKFIGGELAFMRFKEDASDAEIKEVSNLLGLDIKNATYEQYIEKLKTTPAQVFENYRDTLASMTNAKRAIGEAKVKKTDVPVFAKDSAISDGITVFKDANGNYFAVIKNGKEYRVYQNGKLTKSMDKKTLLSKYFGAENTETKQQNAEAKNAAVPEEKNKISENTEEKKEETKKEEPKKETAEEAKSEPKDTSAEETSKKEEKPSTKKVKAPKTDIARKKVLNLVTDKKVDKRLQGAVVKGGKQYISDGKFMCIYDNIVDGVEETPGLQSGYPFVMFDDIMKKVRQSATKDTKVVIDVDKIRSLIPASKKDYIRTLMEIDGHFYQVSYVSRVIDSLQDAKVYLTAYNKMDALYIKGKNGEALVLSVRTVPGMKPVYTAEYAQDSKRFAVSDEAEKKTENIKERVQKTFADLYARKNIKGYDELSERQKIAVRWTIMSGKANGVSEDVITAFARISADTNTNIGFADGVADGITYTNDGEHTIYLNAKGKRTVETGVMHELTHAMKDTEGYAELQALAEQYYSTHETEYNEIKERYESFYKKNNLEFTDDVLADELTAHYVEKQMENRKVLIRMTEDNPTFTKKCLNFLQKIKEHFVKGTDSYADMNSVERKFLSVYNAYKTRTQSKESGKRYSLSSMQKDWGTTLEEMENGAYKNKQGYKDTVVDLSINLFDNNKEKYKNLTEARRSVETQIDGIVKVAVAMKKAGLDIEVAEGSDARDTKGRSLFSSLEPNSDYVTSHDISTECNKRESFQEIYEAIIAKDPTFFYDIGNYFVIHDIMAKKGLTTPCRDCYVESMRKNLAPMAESFISMLHPNKKLGKSNAAKRDRMIISTGEEVGGAAKDGGYIAKYGLTVDYDVKKKDMPLDTKTLNVRMLTTEDGISTLRTLYPEIYEQFNGYYGQAKPKLPRRSAPYRFGELTAMFSTDKGNIKKSLIEKIVAAGGLRFQSYSDFKLKNTTDVLQVVLEAESLGLTGQTYTKVPAFLEVVGDTNMKINISIFTENVNEAEELKAKPDPKELMWKLDKLESFPMSIDDIYEKYVQADKNGNTTIIDVVQNVSNAAWAMVNDKIGYVIPYHKSGMQMEFKRNKKGQRTAIDHTAYQNEKIGAKRVKENLSFHKYWWEDWAKKQSQLDDIMAKEGKNGVIKAKLSHYFDECAKDGRKPKFYDIYLAKDITDICKAQAEKLGLNLSDSDIYFEYKAKNGETWKVPYGYYKFLGDYQVFKPDGTESMPLPLTLEGYDFNMLASRFSDKESIARTELLQQVTDKENFANKSNEEISAEIKKRRQESATESINGKRYALPKTDSQGRDLSAEQQKYFAESKAVDEKGRLLAVYHGTFDNFNIFDLGKTSDANDMGKGHYFTTSLDDANKHYLNQGGDLDAKIDSLAYDLFAEKGYSYEDSLTSDPEIMEILDECYKEAESRYSSKNARLIAAYLNIKNPVYVEEGTKYGSVYDRVIVDKNGKVLPQDIDIQSHYDGIIDNTVSKKFKGVKDGTQHLIVFNSNQIKLISNTAPTQNPDIRYALQDGIDVNEIEGGDRAMTELPQDRLTLRDVVTDKSKVNAFKSQVSGDAKRFTEGWQIMFTNAQAGLERVIKSAGIKEATAKTNYVRAAKYAGMNAIDEEGGQYTLDGEKRVGDSLVKIWSPIYKGQKLGENYKKNPTKNAKNARYEDYQQKFNLYLLHQHNVDRYAEGKMVLGEDITPEVSEKEIAKMDEAYPEFRAVAEKTWKFTDNLLQLAVDSGMYSQEYVDNLREMYPHYVPTYREEHMNGVRSILGARDIAVNAAKKRAKGADTRVLPIDDVIARMTIQRYSSSRINKLLVDLADGFDKNKVSSEDFRILSSEDSDLDMDNGQLVDTKKTSGGYQVTFYRNGKRVTAEVSKAVFSGIDAFAPSGDTTFHNVLLDGVAKVNSTFKKLVTSLNPFFSYFRNPLRDIQDAGLYTRYPLRTFAKNYARARQEITSNGMYWQEAKAAGITSASVFDYEKGITTKQKNKVQRFLDRVEATSNTIEMTPRLAEYISARESGKDVQEALLEAQDVTTNFGRGGVFAKKLNSTIMPFLNPAIQGFSKMVRAYTGKDAAQSYVNLIVRSIMLGIGMAALNDLMNEDDEDYQDLSDYIKETNYVVALGDGEFLKIPKGRVVGVLGEVYLRSKWYLQGDKKAYEGFLKSISQQVTPVDNFSRTIFSPIMDLKNNKTWYGGTIESQKWENTKPSDRYDESTSSIAIWLGKVFDYSPLKINYLLDQYGGVVTDIVLPATSTQAETGIVSQNMLVNSITNSKWSSKFYDTLEDYNYKKTDGDKVSAGVVKYLNDVRSTISDMNKQISEIQQSDLSDEEKLKQEKIIQAAINALEKDALTNVKYLEEELGKYDLSDDTFDADWRDAVSTTIGEEYALKKYNKDVYSKAQTLSTGGIGMGTYYDYYFDVKNIESDKKANGETIAGSKKAKVIAYTWQLNIPNVQKLMLIMSSGYTITDSDIKGINAVTAKRAVAQYITQLDITKEEKLELAKTCGLTVQGNKIIIKNN